ncbi:MAG TPA: Crp/Fnr family transcriptional regulator, partial [Microscillaceae bacterium]|nr:Crp/Fnr family transcriptional regulator [Microscillaceae bacterium]
MESYRQFIENYTTLSDKDWKQISMCFEKQVVEKDEILLQEGK